MSTLKYFAFIAISMSVSMQAAHAADYAVTVDGPLIGSTISRNKVSLGIEVDIDSTWDELSDKEKATWRQFTDLTDPRVTPPFPLPNIREFLKKLKTPERFRTTENITREDGLTLVVRINAEGLVDEVQVRSGTEKGAPELNQSEGILAYVYGNALLKTKFSPAKLDGKPGPSAFPMTIRQVTVMK
jgi:hypothetical protein